MTKFNDLPSEENAQKQCDTAHYDTFPQGSFIMGLVGMEGAEHFEPIGFDAEKCNGSKIMAHEFIKFHCVALGSYEDVFTEIYKDSVFKEKIPEFKYRDPKIMDQKKAMYDIYVLLVDLFLKERESENSVVVERDLSLVLFKIKAKSFQDKRDSLLKMLDDIKQKDNENHLFGWNDSLESLLRSFDISITQDKLRGSLGQYYYFDEKKLEDEDLCYVIRVIFEGYLSEKRMLGYAAVTLYMLGGMSEKDSSRLANLLRSKSNPNNVTALDYLAARIPFCPGVSMRKAYIEIEQDRFKYYSSYNFELSLTSILDSKECIEHLTQGVRLRGELLNSGAFQSDYKGVINTKIDEIGAGNIEHEYQLQLISILEKYRDNGFSESLLGKCQKLKVVHDSCSFLSQIEQELQLAQADYERIQGLEQDVNKKLKSVGYFTKLAKPWPTIKNVMIAVSAVCGGVALCLSVGYGVAASVGSLTMLASALLASPGAVWGCVGVLTFLAVAGSIVLKVAHNKEKQWERPLQAKYAGKGQEVQPVERKRMPK